VGVTWRRHGSCYARRWNGPYAPPLLQGNIRTEFDLTVIREVLNSPSGTHLLHATTYRSSALVPTSITRDSCLISAREIPAVLGFARPASVRYRDMIMWFLISATWTESLLGRSASDKVGDGFGGHADVVKPLFWLTFNDHESPTARVFPSIVVLWWEYSLTKALMTDLKSLLTERSLLLVRGSKKTRYPLLGRKAWLNTLRLEPAFPHSFKMSQWYSGESFSSLQNTGNKSSLVVYDELKLVE